jgi:hypothetical protein
MNATEIMAALYTLEQDQQMVLAEIQPDVGQKD